MTRKTIVGVAVLFIVGVAVSAHAAEHYLRINFDSPKDINVLTRVVSIDHVQPGDSFLHAYANDKQLDALRSLGFGFEELPHPGSLIEPRMAESKDAMATWDSYPSYDAYVAMMYDFETNYPNLCRIINIGTTVQGRALLVAKISDNVDVEEDEPEVFFTSTMHGDETTGYVLMLRLIDSMLVAYGSDGHLTAMVDNMETYINPAANPDGTYITGNSSVSGAQRYNANGVDINRNFPDPQDGPNPDGNPRQPEAQAMMDFAVDHSFIISANLHGGAEVANYPWDTWPQLHPDDDWYVDVCRDYADSAHANSPSSYMDGFNNGITNGYDWYEVNGGRQDYMNYWRGCREITIELSNTKLLPASSLPAHWTYNRSAMVRWLENASYGVRGLVTDAVSSNPVFATVTVLGHDQDSSRVFTDPDVGDYHRMIAAGTYDLEFTAAGYLPQTIYGVSVTDYDSIRVDVQLVPVTNDPVLFYSSNDAGGVDPGESISMHLTVVNHGGGNAVNATGTLMSSDTLVTIDQPVSTYPTILANGGLATSINMYDVTIASGCPIGHVIEFWLDISADGGYSDSLSFSITAGLPIENFESGDFTNLPWSVGGDQPWVITASNPFEGTFSAHSGPITHRQQSDLQVTMEAAVAGNVSFDYKVSSEPGWDYLYFYIDGDLKDSWSGEAGWSQTSYAVSAGLHTYLWRYKKDVSVSEGDDQAWLDYIVFPLAQSDPDGDGFATGVDNCPFAFNPGQEDADSDNVGDVCDNCSGTYNPDQSDADSNGIGDACDCDCSHQGDWQTDGVINVLDVIASIDYVFRSGDAPIQDPGCPLDRANVDNAGSVDVLDVVAMIDHVFRSGPCPIDPCTGESPPTCP